MVRTATALACALACAAAPAGCAHAPASAPPGPGEARLVISLQDINCQSCGAAPKRAVAQLPGVRAAAFDRDRAELSVVYDPRRASADRILAAVRALGYEAVPGAGKGRYAKDVRFGPGLDVAWISRGGADVDIEAHLAPGKVTVFDFYATWCGPCRKVDRAMAAILTERRDVALRKLDVADWSSPVARRYLAKVPALPYVIVYGKGGQRVAAISGLHLDRLRAAIRRAAGDAPARAER